MSLTRISRVAVPARSSTKGNARSLTYHIHTPSASSPIVSTSQRARLNSRSSDGTSSSSRTFASSVATADGHKDAAEDHSSHDAHESHYDPPGGWLFGVPPGQKYQKEGWENTWIYGFCGSMLFGVVAYAYKPDTSITTWALEEARRRLEVEGILEDPFPDGPKVRRSDQPEESGSN